MLVLGGVILLIAAFTLSTLLSWVSRGIARRIGFVDRPGERKIHDNPIALGGGAAFFITTTLMVLAGILFALSQQHGIAAWVPDSIAKYIPGIIVRSQLAFLVLGGGLVIFLLGLCDDIWGLPPIARLAVQTAVALVLAVTSDEFRVTAFAGSQTLSYVLTVLWIVGITNAFNLLDNMDGLSAGVAVVAATMFFVVSVIIGQYFLSAYLLVILGSLLGFLLFNFPPASVFMGDAGSNFIGYMLSVLTVLFTFYMPGRGENPIAAMLIPIVILSVPLYDTISVVFIRLRARRPIFKGDTNHFSHRLVGLGFKRRDAVVTIYCVSLCTGLLAPLLLKTDITMSIMIFANVALMLGLIWILEHTARQRSK